jgi:hypothetical protein
MRGYSKYHNKKTIIDGIVFSSKHEASRYQELKLLERAGKIKDLALQPSFILQDGFMFNNKKISAIKYIADFKYFDIEKQVEVIEDAKGVKTKEYLIKKKLFMKRYNKIIVEV